MISLGFLSLLFITIGYNGYSAFQQTFIRLTYTLDPTVLNTDELSTANYPRVVKKSRYSMFPEVNKTQG